MKNYKIILISIFTTCYLSANVTTPSNSNSGDGGSTFVSQSSRGDVVYMGTTDTEISVSNSLQNSDGTTVSAGQIYNSDGTVSQESSSNVSSQKYKPLKYPLTENLLASTQWSIIMKELEFTMDLGKCGTGLRFAPGIKAHMIDFEGYWERVNQPLNFVFMGIKLGHNPVKSNTPFESSNGSCPRAQVTNSHFISVPLLGMIFKKKMSFWCLNKGTIQIPYLSEFDMTYKYDYMGMKMIPQMIAMFAPQTLANTIFDCAATESAAVLYGTLGPTPASYDDFENYNDIATDVANNPNQSGPTLGERLRSGSRNIVNGIRNSIYYVDGCNGFSPVGGYQNGDDPIVDAHNSFHGVMNILFGASAITQQETFKKKSNFTYLNVQGKPNAPSPVDTMCQPKYFPMAMPSQYALQLAYPTVGEAKEVGQDGITTSSMKNLPGAEGVVFVLWGRRDYYAFAYFCPGDKKK